MQSTANINNNNIELDSTTTISTLHAIKVREPNIHEAPRFSDSIDRTKLEDLSIQTEHDEIEHMTLHILDIINTLSVMLHSWWEMPTATTNL
jgi:hypothetical protein